MLGWSEHSDFPKETKYFTISADQNDFNLHREWIKAPKEYRKVSLHYPTEFMLSAVYTTPSVKLPSMQHLASGFRDENNCLNKFLTMNCTFPRVLVQSRLSDAVPQMSQLGLCCEPIAAPTLSLSRSRRLCACLTCGDPFSASSGGT